MKQKCKIIRSTPQLRDIITEDDSNFPNGHINLQSKHYAAVSCDLADVAALSKITADFSLQSTSVLVIAEVSVTYMEVEAADAVLKLFSSISDCRFCLLEQWMPEGSSHPFASTMLRHFEKLGSPIQSPVRYQDAASQKRRFIQNGWVTVEVNSLWNLWLNDDFISVSERQKLALVEPFDEWEEFALFSCHYFLLIADSRICTAEDPLQDETLALTTGNTSAIKSKFSPYRSIKEVHRHSAVFRQSRDIICHGGYGTRGRLNGSFLYSVDDADDLNDRDVKSASAIQPPTSDRVCHTICNIGNPQSVMIGGRTSPEAALASCFWRRGDQWVKAPDLPEGRYRHCSACVTLNSNKPAVLIFGGKSGSGECLGDWLYWTVGSQQWHRLDVEGEEPAARFAAALATGPQHKSRGHLCGGIGRDGRVLEDFWQWEIFETINNISIKFTNLTSQLRITRPSNTSFGRFGASLVELGHCVYVVGGVGSKSLVPKAAAILKIGEDLAVSPLALETDGPQPLLVGHALENTRDDRDKSDLAIIGGGALCFSFGSFWNKGVYTLHISEQNVRVQPWSVLPPRDIYPGHGKISDQQSNISKVAEPQHLHGTGLASMVPTKSVSCSASKTETKTDIPRIDLDNESRSFECVLATSQPAIFPALGLGRCTETWNLEYLTAQIGPDRRVVVHSSPSADMDFLLKNFEYKTMRFEDFTKAVAAGERVYLRSLSAENPAGKVTNLREDFPSIADDFKLPTELAYVTAHEHSLPLRISGQVNMWLHYDVMANVYCQIQGRKRLVTFHPSQVGKLQFAHGSSSSSIRIFDSDGNLRPEILSLEPHVCDLGPGEVLLIPALWPHGAWPYEGPSVAVNVFFRSLGHGYSPGRDVYGNRDMQAYEKARSDIQRAREAFEKLPKEYGQFYLQRLAIELGEAAVPFTTQKEP